MDAYDRYQQDRLAEAHQEGRVERADNAQDAQPSIHEFINTAPGLGLTPNELMRARLLQVRREFDHLRNRMSDLLDITTTAGDDVAVWVAAIESGARQAREAAKWCEKNLHEAEPAELDRQGDVIRELIGHAGKPAQAFR